jgi:hypothetical protein
MSAVLFDVFQKEEVGRFNGSCERHGLKPSDFNVMGFLSNDESSPTIIRVRVQYLPTGKAAFYMCGESMSWLVSFEIDLGARYFA